MSELNTTNKAVTENVGSDKGVTSKITTEKTSKMSLKGGYEFYFYDAGYEILAHGSSWSGKETIFVNGNEVSNFRNLGRHSLHPFEIGADQYEVEFNMVSMMRGELHCTLVKNDVHFQTRKLSVTKSPTSLFKFTLGGFIIGAIVGFTVVKTMKYWI